MDVQVKLAALVKYIADHGRLFDITKFRKVDSRDNIFEFKPVNHRFFSFFYKGRKIIITNAYMKKSQKVSMWSIWGQASQVHKIESFDSGQFNE